MAEKAISIKEQAGGVPVATRDAGAQDETSADRVIQLVDLAPRLVKVEEITPLRSGITVPDNTLLNPIPAGIAGAVINVADVSALLIYGVVTIGSTDSGTIMVTPVAIGDSGGGDEVYAVLDPVQLRSVAAFHTGEIVAPTDVLRKSATEQFTTITTVLTEGVERLGFYVYVEDIVSFDLYVAPASTCNRNDALSWDARDSSIYGANFPGNGEPA